MYHILLKSNLYLLLFFSTFCFSQTFEVKYEYIAYKGNLKNEVNLVINDSVAQFICDFKSKNFKVDKMDGVQQSRYYINNFYLKSKQFKETSIYKNTEFSSEWELDHKWNITEEKDTIFGFEVKKAFLETNTKAGKLFAWFTTEIPLMGGPFRYCGLPGLILKIHYEKLNTVINVIDIREVEPTVIRKTKNGISLTKEEIILFDENILDEKLKDKN